MLRIKNIKFITIFVCSLLVVVSLIGGIFAFAQRDINFDITSNVNKALSEITQNEFGVPVIKKIVNLNDEKLVIAEDNKYVYKASQKGEIAIIMSKDYDDAVKLKDRTSKDEITLAAEKFLYQYAHKSSGGKYVLVDYKYKDTANEKYHEFIYNEVAPNGVKTGEGVVININNVGELVLLAVHEGNIDVAMKTKPKLNREDAVKVSIDFIKSNTVLNGIDKFPEDNSELTVWKDKLAWSVKIDGIKVENSTYGFDFKVDAITGEILFKDYYCAVE